MLLKKILRPIKKLLRLPIVIYKKIHERLLSILFAPNEILLPSNYIDIKLHEISLNGIFYKVAEVPCGRIFTNQNDNISVTVGRKLVPFVSWQYFDETVLPDAENHFVSKKIFPANIPYYIQGSVVSLLTGGGGHYNYYHWLFDSLPRLELINKTIESGLDLKYYVPENTLNFQKETLVMLGIDLEHTIASNDRPYISTDRCVVSSHPNKNPESIPFWIINFLRESFLKYASDSIFSPLVYIERGDSVNNRRLIDENILVDTLKSIGFQSYRLANLSVAEQIALFSKASMIVGVHGAGFANLAFATKGTVVYELFSANYTPLMYQSISERLELEYCSIYCEDFEEDRLPQQACFKLSSLEIDRIRKHSERVSDILKK